MFFNAPDDDTTTLSLVVLVLVLVLMLVVVVVVVLVVVVVAVAAAALVDALALFALRVASSSIKSPTPHQQIQRDFVLLLLPVSYVSVCSIAFFFARVVIVVTVKFFELTCHIPSAPLSILHAAHADAQQ